jgi:hypothetical protein
MKTRALELIKKNPWIAGRVAGREVLHVGCTDWPLTADRIGSGELLHSLLCDRATRCVGVDLNAEGIAKLREVIPGREFYVPSAEQPDREPSQARNGERHGLKMTGIRGFQWENPTFKNRLANTLSLPFLWLSRGRCADEVAVEFRKAV